MLVHTVLDSFQIAAQGLYQCIVHQPLGISLYELRTQSAAKVLPEKLMKLILMHFLLALDYLHTEVGIIHAGKIILVPCSLLVSPNTFPLDI